MRLERSNFLHRLLPVCGCAEDLESLWDGERRNEVQTGLQEVAESLGEPGMAKRLAAWMVGRFGGEQ